VFTHDQLKQGEFAKLFHFTRLNMKKIKAPKKIQNDLEQGVTKDGKGRLINPLGYYVD